MHGAFLVRTAVVCGIFVAIAACSSPAQEAFLRDQEAAQTGDPVAVYRLARRYWLGNGTERDDAKAVSLFSRVAQKGHLDASYLLAIALTTGRGVAEDEEKAFAWFRNAANRGHAPSQYQVAEAYRNGRVWRRTRRPLCVGTRRLPSKTTPPRSERSG